MNSTYTKEALNNIISKIPSDWLRLTTHRLDIYNESRAKVEFLEMLQKSVLTSHINLSDLPTAYDYIRLGHPLSCVLEWAIAGEANLDVESVISFSSEMMPLMAVLRKNKFLKKRTQIIYTDRLPVGFDEETIKSVYCYDFEVLKLSDLSDLPNFEGSRLSIGESNADFVLSLYSGFGSIIQVRDNNPDYIKEIQHVRRRESIAMTPQNCLQILNHINSGFDLNKSHFDSHELSEVIKSVTSTKGLVGLSSCGLSSQYAIMMGLVHYANDHHTGKNIKFIVPPNCYGGTNDQARRVAACIENVEIVDLPVDSGKNMVDELERILSDVAANDDVPYIIAEIPTNPRVEIPELEKLRATLNKKRESAVEPVFILDQTFCPNVRFFGDNGFLHDVKAISYVSGSKFPSGGLCTAGYCVANENAHKYMSYVEKHLKICDNEATSLQIEILTSEMPSMNERIASAYKNTRAFVDHIESRLPEAKINFVSEELANATFTPSVFSLDLPTKGESSEERENYKRELNHKLISMMVESIPSESKHCVSYGQLKGCYWTIPATSTQGTTKESDKDYIVRVSVAADFDLKKHCDVFDQFCEVL